MLGAFDDKNTYSSRSTSAPQHCRALPTFASEFGYNESDMRGLFVVARVREDVIDGPQVHHKQLVAL